MYFFFFFFFFFLTSLLSWPEFRGNEETAHHVDVGDNADGDDVNGAAVDRLVVDGFFHSTISSKFNDFRRDPFKDLHADGKGESPAAAITPNCRFVEVMIFGWPHVFLCSAEEISADTELTIDYGETFWETLRFHAILSAYATKAQQKNGRLLSGTEVFSLLSKL
jgi:hypothetical protein